MDISQMNKHSTDTRSGSDREAKYLTFSLAQEDFGVGILKVREIIGMQAITPVPQTPYFVKGVINLRGQVIPVVDLRLKFGLALSDYTDRTSIIVLEVKDQSANIPIGIVVDSVSEVVTIKNSDIEGTLNFGTTVDSSFVQGLAKWEGGVKILLDIDRVLSAAEMGVV